LVGLGAGGHGDLIRSYYLSRKRVGRRCKSCNDANHAVMAAPSNNDARMLGIMELCESCNGASRALMAPGVAPPSRGRGSRSALRAGSAPLVRSSSRGSLPAPWRRAVVGAAEHGGWAHGPMSARASPPRRCVAQKQQGGNAMARGSTTDGARRRGGAESCHGRLLLLLLLLLGNGMARRTRFLPTCAVPGTSRT
jgi:hypothetical protein